MSGSASVLALDSSSHDWRVMGAHARHLRDELARTRQPLTRIFAPTRKNVTE